jgi:hypothetical protein
MRCPHLAYYISIDGHRIEKLCINYGNDALVHSWSYDRWNSIFSTLYHNVYIVFTRLINLPLTMIIRITQNGVMIHMMNRVP